MAFNEQQRKEVQDMIDAAFSARPSVDRVSRETIMKVMAANDRAMPLERFAFLRNYRVFNATSISQILPYGTLVVTDEGTTPTRSLALIWSDGKAHYELAAIVV